MKIDQEAIDVKRERSTCRVRKPCLLGRLLALLPISCALLYPLYLAGQLDLTEETYASQTLPEAFSGLRLVYLSDIHYGKYLSAQRVAELAARINELRPDIVILGGDYGEDTEGAIAFFRILPRLEARLSVLGVMGNHDRTPPESAYGELLRAMREAGVRPLVNDVQMFMRDGATMAVASVDDFYNGHPDVEAVARLCADADFTIFAPHTPDILPAVYQRSGGAFFQLALCGHTHGGQVAIAGHSLKSSSNYGDRYRAGWYHENGVDILVSCGVGTSFLPVRLGTRPQFHLITLQRAKK